jgi:hypothetical protein
VPGTKKPIKIPTIGVFHQGCTCGIIPLCLKCLIYISSSFFFFLLLFISSCSDHPSDAAAGSGPPALRYGRGIAGVVGAGRNKEEKEERKRRRYIYKTFQA